MPRRLWFRAALAALAVPALAIGPLAGSAYADGSGGPGGAPSDDPGVQTQLRKTQSQTPPRAVVSRRAKRQAAARAEKDTPLDVTIEQLTPSTLPEVGRVRVSGIVTNNDTQTWRTINVYAFVSDQPMTSAAQLAAAADTAADAVVGRRITDKKDVIAELAPGQQQSFSFSVPRRLLQAESPGLQGGEPGVYWFGVHALGEGPEGRDETADGRARTFLPFVPAARRGDVPTALVIPLRRQLIYDADGSLADPADWAQTLSPDGRLRSLVDFGASSGGRSVTWVVDPALIDAVRRLADGNPGRSLAPNLKSGEDDGEDTGAEDASAGPDASPTAPGDPAGPTGSSESPTAAPDVSTDGPLDLDALDPAVQNAAQAAQAWLARLGEAMRPEDQVLTLPYGDVDAAAAAVHDPQLLQRAVARAGTSLPGFDVSATPVLSSPSGYLSSKAIEDAAPGTTILLTDAMFGSPAPALAETEGHEVVVTSTGAAEGGPGPDGRMGLTAMRQRLLSEAAVRFLHHDESALTVVVPHDWRPSGGGTFFSGLHVPWLDLAPVESVRRSTPATSVEGSTLRYPGWQQEAELDQAAFDSAEALIRSGATLQNLLTLNNVVAGTVTDQALGTLSYSARTSPIANRAAAEAARRWIEQRLAQVVISAPRAVTLSSASGRFQATVTNGLDQPVTVALDAASDDRLGVEGPARVDIPAHGRSAILLTARTNENGIHEVVLLVTDKRGTPLGARTALTIRSAQVSNVIWLFVGIGAALLFGAIVVRLFRRIRNARRTPEAAEPEAADGEPSEHPEPAGVGRR
jgi:hypothetical protein